ncbi:carbamoyltransferase family protein [Maridesulfovibrio salexigens]|uniref:Carbamoyltransferase n=1 Tax=Maridesulfovibrio salexigens (strain ATCC 14822 / DSM 2638 / NCIMB 8403 / VKM B-1763) TaxID=526222 RepID=C6BXW3_MARSD|nr:carbamoyltransferase [Maridesulfovibrio salexigens]ACS78671.1 Carbamoyltransferase [Maridesulfovibrio salexigens DSM 2638]
MHEVILGISAYYHDSAAVIMVDGEIVAAAQEERFTRIKHDESFPINAIKYVLEESGYSLSEVKAVAFYDKPLLKFERLLETYNGFAPTGLKSFVSAIPVWIKEKLFMRRMINEELAKIGPTSAKLLFPEHHLSHGASAFYPSPFQEAAILTVDGVGEWATTTISKGEGNDITVLKELQFPHSVGLFYSAATAFCGFKVNSGEYKLMGLAPYGNSQSPKIKEWKKAIFDNLVDLKSDGSLLLNMDYFSYATELTMFKKAKWEALFGIPAREPETEIQQEYMDLAYAVQEATEEIVFALAKAAKKLTNSRNLVMAGGVALNCVANGKLIRSKIFDKIWIQPASGDAGGSLGAALAAHHIWLGNKRVANPDDSMRGAYLGPEFSEQDILRMAKRQKAPFHKHDSFKELCSKVTDLMTEGKAIGWFQGRMEFGPRALGGRSIIGDPRHPEMQKKLNLKIKFREGFRPFAPSVLEEQVSRYFEMEGDSPYMLVVAPVVEDMRKPIPDNYHEMPMYERLYQERSDLPAITHVDFSARVQSVSKKTNPRYWELINTFSEKEDCGVVVNTSFNVRGEPIVCTPHDAYVCFMRTNMDALVVGDFLFIKEEQPKWEDGVDWTKQFELD